MQAPARTRQDLGLAGWGWGVFHALPKPLMVDYSSPHPFPPVPQARLGAWPPVCWQDWGWGGGEATSNCPGKTSSLLTSLLSRRRGKRPGQAHPMPGSYLSPPSSLTLLFSPRPKQAWAPRPGGERSSPTSQKVREPSTPEAGSPEAGPEASIRGQCPAWSPLTTHPGPSALG